MNLKNLRKQIDKIDSNILKLLNERTKIALKIKKLKAEKGLEPYTPDREKALLARLVNQNKGILKKESVVAIFREIMSAALSVEKPLRVAYLGPLATFTHLASLKKFGSSVEYVSKDNISDIFSEIEKGSSDYGVVPIENSIEGAVNHTLDMFIDSDLKICSEVMLTISHNLLSNSPLNKVRRIYSNPQVFGQCRNWLETNIHNVEFIEVSSTTKAAELASKTKYSAAIASTIASKIYNLKIVAERIEDYADNVTRFLVIGNSIPNPTGNDKSSIMFSIKDKVGALHDMLTPFKRNRINLTKIESRPSKKKAWEYYFFVDFLGHISDSNVKRALDELMKGCMFLKILGSYPISE
ncbi:MAG: prephenate dehydratase [Candidatus Omnitrophica bacterium]|nr:prephenate dehydratase [Candidatus Omnitrophota bacterium]